MAMRTRRRSYSAIPTSKKRIAKMLATLTSTFGSKEAPCEEPREDKASEQERFSHFLERLKLEALERGVSEDTFLACTEHLRLPEPSSESVVLDRGSAEVVESVFEYVSKRASDEKADLATRALLSNASQANRISEHYGVPTSVLGAIWCLESCCGRYNGEHDVMQSLACLACDAETTPKRKQYYLREMVSAMILVERLGLAGKRARFDGRAKLKGSYAGAIGQCQFMPSNALVHAVDWDGDGFADVWRSVPDALASMANYLVSHGWKGNEACSIAYPISFRSKPVDSGPCEAKTWLASGTASDAFETRGASVPPSDESRVRLLEMKVEGLHFLVGNNYDVVMRYNPSHKYALTVGILSDKIRARLEGMEGNG